MHNHVRNYFRITLAAVLAFAVSAACTARTDSSGGDSGSKNSKTVQTDSSGGDVGSKNSKTVQVTDSTFSAEVEGASEPLVLVDFWAAWCGPCKMIAPSLDNIAAQYAGRVKVCKVDVDSNEGLARRFSASSIPLVILFKNGVQLDQKVGAFPEATYREWVESNL